MQEVALTEWLTSPETRALVLYLRQRQAAAVEKFLAAQPVEPLSQGKAAGLHEIEKLLLSPSDIIRDVFNTALRQEHKTK